MENIGNFRSFWKSNNKHIHIPRKLTGVPGCVRTVGTDSNNYPPRTDQSVQHREYTWTKTFGGQLVRSSRSCWKNSPSTFPFLSNFDGLIRVVPDLIQTPSDPAELRPPITAPHQTPNVARGTLWFNGHVFVSFCFILLHFRIPHHLFQTPYCLVY